MCSYVSYKTTSLINQVHYIDASQALLHSIKIPGFPKSVTLPYLLEENLAIVEHTLVELIQSLLHIAFSPEFNYSKHHKSKSASHHTFISKSKTRQSRNRTAASHRLVTRPSNRDHVFNCQSDLPFKDIPHATPEHRHNQRSQRDARINK